jgi:hypothetical protein
MLHRAWSSAGALVDAARDQEAAIRQLAADREAAIGELAAAREQATARAREVGQLTAELEQAMADASEARRTLEIVRNSRLMRHTATARRLYYRLQRMRRDARLARRYRSSSR